MALLTWPKQTPLGGLLVSLSPGRLLIETAAGTVLLDCQDPAELRRLGMLAHAAAVEHDLDVQEAAVKASIERRRLRGLGGNRHSPVHERPEPPAHMSLERPA